MCVQAVFIGVCRDLTGIVRATTNKKQYCWVFDALYPRYFPVFFQAAEVRGTDVQPPQLVVAGL